ncbi:MAG: EamA family transporter [Desulfuromusa sp.]|jgi:DME family drug/metabolite transporter|nr:EamA family transporter [Desulfuromusa sp.]
MQLGRKDSKPFFGYICIILAAVLFGTSGTVQALAPAGAQPEVLGAIRLAISGTFLSGITLLLKRPQLKKRWPIIPTISAAISTAALQICFFSALPITGVALGTSIFIGSFPVFTGVFSFILYRERPTSKWIFASLLAIVGCFLLLGVGENFNSDFSGIALALGAGGFLAIFTLSAQFLLKEHSVVAVLAITFTLGAILMIPAFFGVSLHWLTQTRGVVVSLYLGIVATILPYLLFVRGLRTVNASTAATLNLVEPLTAAILGVALLQEQLSLTALTGMALLIGGVAILSIPSRVKLL